MTDRLEFSREWNIPVHHFLRRHVYYPAKMHWSPSVAMFITFLISSIAHELVMSCITKKLRGYGFLAMMLQLPIVAVQQSKFFRGKKTFNVCFGFLCSVRTVALIFFLSLEPWMLTLRLCRMCSFGAR